MTKNNPVYIHDLKPKTQRKIENIAKKNNLSKTFVYNALLEKALSDKKPIEFGLKTNG